jgi:hypothetical protein
VTATGASGVSTSCAAGELANKLLDLLRHFGHVGVRLVQLTQQRQQLAENERHAASVGTLFNLPPSTRNSLLELLTRSADMVRQSFQRAMPNLRSMLHLPLSFVARTLPARQARELSKRTDQSNACHNFAVFTQCCKPTVPEDGSARPPCSPGVSAPQWLGFGNTEVEDQ